MESRYRPVVAALVDLALVALFVVIGRASHGERPDEFGTTFWPFAVGLAVGWAAGRVWRHPFALLRGGVPAWLGTVVVGLLLRAVSGQGIAPTFAVVTTVLLGVFLIGWRLLPAAVARASTRPDPMTPVGRYLGGRR